MRGGFSATSPRSAVRSLNQVIDSPSDATKTFFGEVNSNIRQIPYALVDMTTNTLRSVATSTPTSTLPTTAPTSPSTTPFVTTSTSAAVTSTVATYASFSSYSPSAFGAALNRIRRV